MGCLQSLVGITPNDCACIDTEGELAPATGLYVDDMEVGVPILPIKSAADCGAGSIVNIIDRARAEAENSLLVDLHVMIRTYNRVRLKKVDDVIGKVKSNVGMAVTEDYVGLKLFNKGVKGGSFKIRKFKLNIDSPASPLVDRTIFIYDSEGNEVDTFAVKPNTFIEPDITLQTSKTYSIVFDRSQFNDTVLNNRLTCSCAGASKGWNKYYNINGVKADEISTIIDSKDDIVTLTYGFTLFTTSDCEDIESWLCDDMDLFISQPYYKTIAKVYQLYVIKKVINYILNSNAVNRYTLLDNERLMGRNNKVQKMINDYMHWLANNVDQDYNNCWLCGNKRNYSKASIITTQSSEIHYNIK